MKFNGAGDFLIISGAGAGAVPNLASSETFDFSSCFCLINRGRALELRKAAQHVNLPEMSTLIVSILSFRAPT